MLTEDTITDTQIRELREEALAAHRTMSMVQVGRSGHWLAGDALVDLCDDALEEVLDACARYPMPARARCAEILNARAKDVGRGEGR